jgi:hypothetical protein
MIARLIAVSSLVLFVSTGLANATPSPPYYLALGDSLALGIQPNAAGALLPTNRGYVDHLYALSKLHQPSLRLKKLGCSGETTTTMIDGGVCEYTRGSQLADALAFIMEENGDTRIFKGLLNKLSRLFWTVIIHAVNVGYFGADSAQNGADVVADAVAGNHNGYGRS